MIQSSVPRFSLTNRNYLPACLGLGLVLVLGGCSQHQAITPNVSVPPPEAYRAGPGDTPLEATEEAWWESFQDPLLSRWIGEALGQNLDLKAAWSRLSQSQSGRAMVQAAERPSSTLSLSSARSQFFFPGVGPVNNDRSSAIAPVSWEVDLFGKLNAASSAARLEAVATREDLEALALSLSGEIATAYVGLREQQARHRLFLAQLATNADLLDSLRVRFTQGQSSSLDYYQQEQLVQGRRAQLQLIEAEQARLENRLAVLLGQAPGSLEIPDQETLPELPDLPGLGIPSDLLERRPDLRAAFRRIQASDQRVAQAVRDRLPVVSLGATFSYQATYPSGVFRKLLRGLSAGLDLPFLDGGRRRAQIRQRQAQVEELLHRYSQTFLLALEEVETTLAQDQQQQEYLTELEAQESTAQRSFDIATARYQEGVEDFLRVLTTLGSLQQVQDSLVQGRAQLLRLRIRLSRALGGSWTGTLSRPSKEASP